MGFYSLYDLDFVLKNIFFHSEYNQPSDRFGTLTFDFESRIGPRPERESCGCEECVSTWMSYGCGTITGRQCAWDSYIDSTVDNAFRLIHFWKIYMKLARDEGNEGDTTLIRLNKRCVEIVVKYWTKSILKVPRQNFFSCCPKIRIDISEGEVSKMTRFCEKYFTSQYFKKVQWVLESGKHIEKPNLHFHLLGLYNENGSKNFRQRVLREAWDKLYPNNPLEWKRGKHIGIDNKACCTQQMIDDKLKYLSNDSKGSHENFVDLKKNGGF